jgi:hypothetical protein
MHVGHTVPFEFTKYDSELILQMYADFLCSRLQDVFAVPLIIMLTDDEVHILRKADNRGGAIIYQEECGGYYSRWV